MFIINITNNPNDKIVKTYRGNGKISSPDSKLYDCSFTCEQTVSGSITCKCDAPNMFITPFESIDYLGLQLFGITSTDNDIKLNDCRLLSYHSASSELILSASELVIDYNNDWNLKELNFYISNLTFLGNLINGYFVPIIHLNYNGYDISIRKLEEYNDIEKGIKKSNGIDITSIMTIKLPSYDAYTTDIKSNAIEMASNICELLSFAVSHKVEWIYYNLISNSGEIIRSYHRTPVKNRSYQSSWYLIMEDTPGDLEDFLNKSIDSYIKKKDNLKLDERIELFLNALLDNNYLDYQCLLLSVLLDSLTGGLYPNVHNNFIEKLKNLPNDLKIDINSNELDEIIDIRNHLAHEARLLELYEPSKVIFADKKHPCHRVVRFNNKQKVEQFFLLHSFVVRVILAILNYDGYYYDWRFHVPGEWIGAGMTARTKMRYLP